MVIKTVETQEVRLRDLKLGDSTMNKTTQKVEDLPTVGTVGNDDPEEVHRDVGALNPGADQDFTDADLDDVLGDPSGGPVVVMTPPTGQSESHSADAADVDLTVQTGLRTMAVVQVYKPKCLSCGHLVSWAPNVYNSCHSSAGNALCPAGSMRITEHIPLDKIISAFKEAENQGDLARVSRLYAQVAKRPDWIQQRINDELKKARARPDW